MLGFIFTQNLKKIARLAKTAITLCLRHRIENLKKIMHFAHKLPPQQNCRPFQNQENNCTMRAYCANCNSANSLTAKECLLSLRMHPKIAHHALNPYQLRRNCNFVNRKNYAHYASSEECSNIAFQKSYSACFRVRQKIARLALCSAPKVTHMVRQLESRTIPL